MDADTARALDLVEELNDLMDGLGQLSVFCSDEELDEARAEVDRFATACAQV